MMVNECLKRLRVGQKISQTELGWRVGVSRITISNIERGVHNPNVTLALRIADYFGVSVFTLFGRDRHL